MRPLSAQRALEAWEEGQRSDPLERPLALLAAALPEHDSERLSRLPLGRRDALLMRLRERTFGRRIQGFARCPKCDARLEFPLDLGTYDTEAALATLPTEEEITAEGYSVRYRLPDSADLVAMARSPDVESARQLLTARCVLAAEKDGRPVPAAELPEEVLAALGAGMEALDPLAYLSLAIECARCGHEWLVLFDIGTILWQEIERSAEGLLDDVQALALAYGWSEAEILSMSDARRRFYLSKLPSTAG